MQLSILEKCYHSRSNHWALGTVRNARSSCQLCWWLKRLTLKRMSFEPYYYPLCAQEEDNDSTYIRPDTSPEFRFKWDDNGAGSSLS